jgi:hypothetical protein
LVGFVSEQEMAKQQEIELVFFYRKWAFGPKLIRTGIVIDDALDLPSSAI